VSFMKLAPEAVRIRRLARAHAAGELSEAEYRASRRAVIENFAAGVAIQADEADDNTRPRWDEDITLRGGGDAGLPTVALTPAPTSTSALGRRLLWWMTLIVAAVAVLLALPRAMAATTIPAVSERSADPAASPRLPLSAVRVRWGLGEADAQPGPDRERLQQRAEAMLADVRARHAPGPHGFSAVELDELARLLNALGVHDPQGGLDEADAADVNALIRDQKERRGISVMELEEVARAVQQDARDQGYFLAAAYVPAQTVSDGVAYIDVLPGRLGDVVVDGRPAGAVATVFGPLLGRPVTLTEVSSGLQTLSVVSGIDAQASFGPGDRPGESRLRLAVQPRPRWQVAAALDNHGEESTGEHRVSGALTWLDPRGVGDRLSAGVVASIDPANQAYVHLGYDLPVGDRYRIGARIANNDFTRDDVVDLDGSGVFVDLTARRNLQHSRTRSDVLIWSATHHALEWDGGVDQSVTMLGAGLAAQRVWDGPRVAADAVLHASVGRQTGDRFVGQDGTFWLLELETEAWMPAALPGLPGEQKVVARLAGQWTDAALPTTRCFALGGANRARGIERETLLGDRGVLLGLEVRQPVSVGELLLFGEFAYGDRRGEQAWGRIADVGLGWQATWPGGVSSRVSIALPFGVAGSGDLDDDGTTIFWSLRYDR
jgi:hemolysin activation/secretion protein